MAVKHTILNERLSPSILLDAGWEETHTKQEGCRTFVKCEEREGGLPDCFVIKFNDVLDLILLEFNGNGMRVPISRPIAVGDFNTFLEIIGLEKYEINDK
jgi:hypothetical protein